MWAWSTDKGTQVLNDRRTIMKIRYVLSIIALAATANVSHAA